MVIITNDGDVGGASAKGGIEKEEGGILARPVV